MRSSGTRARRSPAGGAISRDVTAPVGCSLVARERDEHCARSSTDRASDYGSEGWGFESLRARNRSRP